MNCLDEKRSKKLVHLMFHRVGNDKSIKLDFAHEIIDNVDKEVLYADIELNDKESKIFNKIKKLDYFNRLVLKNFNFVDQDGNIFTTRKIEYFYNNNTNKYKIKITLTELDAKSKEKLPHNHIIAQAPNMKSVDDYKREAQTSGMKTTTQKYLKMNHSLIQLRDAIFDPNVVNEKDEDEETQKRVVDALDVLCHYLDDYKAINGIKTHIKE